ncbi:MAG: TlpA disulfide reductase family protein [bacterium]
MTTTIHLRRLTHLIWPLISLLVLALWTPLPAQAKIVKEPAADINPVKDGNAPGFDLHSLGVTSVRLTSKDLYGKKLVLISFWATWCGPCVKEAPALNELYRDYKDQVQFIGISQDRSKTVQADMQAVANFVEAHALDYPMAMDSDGKYGDRFKVSSIPKLVFIDLKGNIVKEVIGFDTAEQLRTEFFANFPTVKKKP